MPRSPYKWNPEFVRHTQAFISASESPSISQLAKYLGVSRETVYVWRREYPAFREALIQLFEARGTYNYGFEETRTDV